jgi:Na+/H+ antiporter NhaD/arsenite permease-like protein
MNSYSKVMILYYMSVYLLQKKRKRKKNNNNKHNNKQIINKQHKSVRFGIYADIKTIKKCLFKHFSKSKLRCIKLIIYKLSYPPSSLETRKSMNKRNIWSYIFFFLKTSFASNMRTTT